MENKKEFDVFLAHNSVDKPVVNQIYKLLKERDLNPWFDEDKIVPGQSFLDEIQKAIPLVKSAAIFLSKELGQYQHWELNAFISQCVEYKIPLIPVLLPGFNKDEWPKSITLFVNQRRWVDFSEFNGNKLLTESHSTHIDLLVWGITGNQPKTIIEKLEYTKPGGIPKKEYLIEILSKEIVEKQGNLYLEPLIMLTSITRMIDILTKEIRDKKFNLFNKIPIFLPREQHNNLLNENIISKILHKLLEDDASINKIIKDELTSEEFQNIQKENNNIHLCEKQRKNRINKKIIACYLLKILKNKDIFKDNYASGNILNLLLQLNLETDFRYFDLSGISIWEADLEKANLTGIDFTNSDLKNSIFSEPLGCIHSVAFSADGNYFATGDAHGSIRVHKTENLELCYFKNESGSQIWSVAFSSEVTQEKLQKFAWGGEDGSVRLFEIKTDTSSGKLEFKNIDLYDENGRVLSGRILSGRVLSVAFSPDGNTLAVGGDGEGNAIRLFDIKNNRMQLLKASSVSCITFTHNDFLISCSNDGSISNWDLKNQQNINSYKPTEPNPSQVRCIAFNRKNLIASGDEDGKVKLWPYMNFAENSCYELPLPSENSQIRSQIRTLAFSQDGDILAVGCIDNNHNGQSEHKILLYQRDQEEWKLFPKLLDNSDSNNGHEHLIRSVAFSPNSEKPKLLISGGDGRTVKRWDWDDQNEKWECQHTLRGYANRIWSVAFFGKDKNKTSKEQQTTEKNEPIFACGCEDNKIYIWNYNDRTHIPIQTLSKHTDWVWSVAFNYDGTLLASGSEDQTIGLWRLQDQKWHLIKPLADDTSHKTHPLNITHTKRVRCVAFHPKKNILASAGNDNKVILWDCKDLNDSNDVEVKEPKKLTSHIDRVLSLAFSPDGRYLASSSRDKTIHLIEILENNQQLINDDVKVLGEQKDCHQDQVHSIAFLSVKNESSEKSEKELFLISGGFDGKLKLWDVNSDKCIDTKDGSQRILSVACHSTKPMIASAGHDHIITLWEIKKSEKEDKYELEQIKQLKGHKRAVESVVFTPDGQRLISCGQDQTIKFWEVEGNVNISIHTIELGKPYQGMNISGVKNLDDAQISALEELGASRDEKISWLNQKKRN